MLHQPESRAAQDDWSGRHKWRCGPADWRGSKMQFKARTVVGSLAPLALGLLTACAPARDGGFDFVDDGDPPPPGLCSALEGLHIAAAGIGLPTRGATIESAERVEADVEGNTNGDYCKVLGAIHPVDYTAPDIHFQVNLPAHWN